MRLKVLDGRKNWERRMGRVMVTVVWSESEVEVKGKEAFKQGGGEDRLDVNVGCCPPIIKLDLYTCSIGVYQSTRIEFSQIHML